VIKGTFTYSNCGSCTITEENGPAEIKVLKTSHETAEVTREYLVHVNCFGFINCYYIGFGQVGTAKGALLSFEANGEISLEAQVVVFEKGSFCPTGTTLDIRTRPTFETYITN